MKATFKMNITLGGKLVIEENTSNVHAGAREHITDAADGTTKNSNVKTIDFSGMTMDISSEQTIDDITTKEYVEAIGSAIKDVIGATVAKFKGGRSCPSDAVAKNE